MATTSDPRASGFNADQFRDAVRFAMTMGAPNNTNERVTFRWRDQKTFTTDDSGGNPYDFSASPTATVSQADVQVNCAVEFAARSTVAGGTSMGEFDPTRITVTVLDDDYADISTADVIYFADTEYEIHFIAPPIGLFGVTVYQIHARATDEV